MYLDDFHQHALQSDFVSNSLAGTSVQRMPLQIVSIRIHFIFFVRHKAVKLMVPRYWVYFPAVTVVFLGFRMWNPLELSGFHAATLIQARSSPSCFLSSR